MNRKKILFLETAKPIELKLVRKHGSFGKAVSEKMF
jgi:hypothetical protein